MKTEISKALLALAATCFITVAHGQDASYSSKPWLRYQPQRKPITAYAAVPSAALPLQSYGSKPWLRPEKAFEIALAPDEKPAAARARIPAEEAERDVQSYSSKTWLRRSR